MKIKYLFLLAGLLLIVLLAACTTRSETPTSTVRPLATTVPASETPLPSNTLSPTETPRPTQTVTPEPSSTPTLTITPSPTSGFVGFQVQFAEYRFSNLSLGFVIPGIQVAYHLEVSGLPFTCELQSKYPDRLFCNGPYFPAGKSVTLVFFTPDGKTRLYQTAYVVTPLVTATIDPYTLTSASCPVRGLKAYCETENRIADNGKCIVSTCHDSCGYWYSLDTCFYKTPFIASVDQTRIAATKTAAAKP